MINLGVILMLKTLAAKLFSKKNLVSWGSAIVMLLGAAAVGMTQPEFKEAVCGAPTIPVSDDAK
jgi:hypothetical protein